MAKSDLDDFAKDLLGLAQTVSSKKEARQLLRQEGTKLKKKTVAEAKKKVRKKTGNLYKSIKRGKPYTYGGEETVRVYGTNHAHLLNNGHKIVAPYTKKEKEGFVEGKHFFESAEEKFKDEFYSNVEKFVDEIINNNNL